MLFNSRSPQDALRLPGLQRPPLYSQGVTNMARHFLVMNYHENGSPKDMREVTPENARLLKEKAGIKTLLVQDDQPQAQTQEDNELFGW